MVRVITGVLVQCDPPTMMVIEQMNEEKQFIIYRISDTDVLIKDGVESWLEEEVLTRLERAERGNPDDIIKWKDKE